MDQADIYDLVFEWAFRCCPMLLCDEAAFAALYRFVLNLLAEAVRQEREAAIDRRSSPSLN